VNDHELHPSADVTAADWPRPRLRRFASAVSAVVPDGFPAYVRILHPARGPKGRPVRWAEVAAWSGRSMHRPAQFHAISRPTSAARTGPAPWDGEPPPEGNLPAELLGILCAALAQHTSSPASCWLCLWDGYGWVHGSPSVAIMGRHGSIPSHRRSLPRYWTEPASGFRAETTYCSPDHWRQHPNSAGPTRTASSSPRHPTCSGRPTTPGAWPPRSTCSAPWSAGQMIWPRLC
jgi:hypothetical protein